jgi:alkanesulfonate monooxygenase SsuD/methylene tetrahydromethanopterin reductase-like flavin-dependent oxidoreductase (luciferase family)
MVRSSRRAYPCLVVPSHGFLDPPMKFGLHYLLSCADGQSPVARYRETLEQATRAEALGFESVWPVEHHFAPNVSILPCPALLLAAVAARTRTLRLGTAIVQLPLAHPLRVAEELATLDVLSDGRVEFGVGRGGNPTHFAGYGVPMAESRDRMSEALDFIRAAWTADRFSFHGRFFEADDLALSPRPVQRPHPPIRVAANSVDTATWAGRAGHPILVASNVNPIPALRTLVPQYRRARAEAGHPADADDVTLLMPVFVGERRAEIQRDVAPSVRQFAHNAASVAAPWLARASDAERPKLQAILDGARAMTYDTVNDVTGIFDTPDACIERLRWVHEELGPGRVICWFNFGGLIPHERVMRSMELFSSHVMPFV